VVPGFPPQYVAVREIASGGFATVWEGHGESDGDPIAIKLPHPSAKPDDLARFRREVRLQSQLEHENILPIIDYGVDGDRPWYAAPLAEGSLAHVLPALSRDVGLILFEDAMRGIQFAHRNRVLHRDLKPQNILIFPATNMATRRLAKVADFGLGRAYTRDTPFETASRFGAGTPWFTAPEQWTSLRDADQRADVFSLGRVLQYILESIDMPGSTLSRRLEYCIRTATADRLENRYRSVDELAADFRVAVDRPAALRRPVDVTLDLIQKAIEGGSFDTETSRPLAQFLLEHRTDVQLMLGMMPRIPTPLLASLLSGHLAAMRPILSAYTKILDDPLTVDSVLTCLRFLEDVFELSDDLEVQELVLLKSVDMACSYDLAEASYIVIRSITSIRTESVLQGLVRHVRNNPDVADWCVRRLVRTSLPDALQSAMQGR
jgi:serine/threonine protein kinase